MLTPRSKAVAKKQALRGVFSTSVSILVGSVALVNQARPLFCGLACSRVEDERFLLERAESIRFCNSSTQ